MQLKRPLSLVWLARIIPRVFWLLSTSQVYSLIAYQVVTSHGGLPCSPHKIQGISAVSCAPSMRWVPVACCCWMILHMTNSVPTLFTLAQCGLVWGLFFGTRSFPPLFPALFNGHACRATISMVLLPMQPMITA